MQAVVDSILFVEIVTEQMLQPQVVSIHYSRYRISFDILHELGL